MPAEPAPGAVRRAALVTARPGPARPGPARPGQATAGGRRRLNGRAAALAVLLVLAAAVTPGCRQREAETQLRLPATSVVATNEVRGIVTADSLRVRAQASVRSEVLSYLRRGEVVEVLQRGEQQERIDGALGYWLEVTFEGVRGWAFGSHLEVLAPGAADGGVNARVQAALSGD